MSRTLSIIEQRIVWTQFRRESDKTVLRELARWFAYRLDGTQVCPPDVPALAAKTKAYGISPRTTERALARLVEAGYLEVTNQQHRGPTTYRLVLDRLAIRDPDELHVAGAFDRQSGGQVADKTTLVRQSGGQVADKSLKNGPDSEKVADNAVLTRDLYVQRSGTPGDTHTHTGADAPTATMADETRRTFRHPKHAYCGAWFCVPDFLEEQFTQQSGVSKGELEAWYQTLNARCIHDHIRIGDALKWLRARFAELVRSLPAPQQLAFGPMVVGVPLEPVDHAVPVDNAWTAILARVKDKVTRQNFDTWFRWTHLIAADAQTVTVRVATSQMKDWLTSHYGAILREAISETNRPNLTIAFVTAASDQEKTG